MKKIVVLVSKIALVIIFSLVLILPKSNIKNAEVVISKDYSTITYDGNIYVPIQKELLPLNTLSCIQKIFIL